MYIYLEQWIGLTIAYYSGRVILRSTKSAYLFALTLRFSTYVLYNDFARCDIGESWALLFVPMVFAGFYLLLKENSMRGSLILALGLILERYCHILTTLLTVVFIMVCYICYYLFIKKNIRTIFLLFNAGIIFILGSLCITVPIISMMASVKINKPNINTLDAYNLTFSGLISNSINNNLEMDSPNIGLILVITLILGFIGYQKRSKLMRHIYLLSVILTIMTVNLFPWSIFSKTPVSIIQFPWRLFIIIIVLLSLYFADFAGKNFSFGQCIIFTTLILAITISSQMRFNLAQNAHYQTLQTQKEAINGWGYLLDDKATFKIKSRNLISSLSSRSLDYLPEKAIKNNENIFEHKVLIDSKKIDLKNNQIISGYQNISYNLSELSNGRKIQLPFLAYSKNYYRVYRNNKQVPFTLSSSSTIQISKVKNSKNTLIKVQFITPILWKIANIISFVVLLLLLVVLIMSVKLNSKFRKGSMVN